MTTPPYIRIPRSLLENNLWKGLSLKYQHIFLILLENVNFEPEYKFDAHGTIITLEPGQFGTTFRDFADLCHKDVSKSDIEGFFLKLKKYEFIRQETRHSKTIVTITHKETYELIKQASQTRSQTKVRQDSDKIQTQSNNIRTKEYKEPEPPTPFSGSGGEEGSLHFLDSWNLTDEDKAKIMRHSPNRIALAIEYAKIVPPTKDAISQILWHCSQAKAPEIPEKFQPKAEKPVSEAVKKQQEAEIVMENNLILAERYFQAHKGENNLLGSQYWPKGQNFIISNGETTEKIYLYALPSVFENQLVSALRKLELWKPQKIIEFDRAESM
jgi:hypothetical protein